MFLYLIVVAWVFVVGVYAIAEAVAPNGSILGALMTVVFWGALPLAIILYLLTTPQRRKKLAEQDNQQDKHLDHPSHAAPADAVGVQSTAQEVS